MATDNFSTAIKYIKWAKRQGFSYATALIIPLYKRFNLSKRDRRILRGIIANEFKKR